MAKVVKLKDEDGDVFPITKGKILFDGSLTEGQSAQLGNLSEFEYIDIYVHANGSSGYVRLAKINNNFGGFGVNWQAIDNRAATYYMGGRITIEGLLQVLWTGFSLSTNNVDNIRVTYPIRRVVGIYE